MACDGGGCSGFCWQSCSGGCGGTSSGCGSSDCSDSCANCSAACGDCSGGCGGGCKGCGGACSTNCDGCSGCWGCSGTCSGGCIACTGTCTGTCNNGCSGGEYTRVYINLTLQTLIMADDIVDLKNLVKNEAIRRKVSTIDTSQENRGMLAEFQTIDAILTNLRNANAIPQNSQTYGDVMSRDAMLEYISLAKQLYNTNLVK